MMAASERHLQSYSRDSTEKRQEGGVAGFCEEQGWEILLWLKRGSCLGGWPIPAPLRQCVASRRMQTNGIASTLSQALASSIQRCIRNLLLPVATPDSVHSPRFHRAQRASVLLLRFIVRRLPSILGDSSNRAGATQQTACAH